MINMQEVLETNNMIAHEKLDVATYSSSPNKSLSNILAIGLF